MAMNISPENEKLLDEAVASGQYKSQDEALTEALRLLRENGNHGEARNRLASGEWRRKFERHLASTPKTAARTVDDSRESIYEGRGG